MQQTPATARPQEPSGRATPTTTRPRPAVIGGQNASRVQKLWERAARGVGTATAVSRALGRVAYSNGQGIALFALDDGEEVDRELSTCSPVLRGGLAYTGERLVIVCQHALLLREGATLTPRELPLAPAAVTATAVAGDWVALAHRDGVLRLQPLDGGTALEIPVPGPPIDVKSLALSPDGTRLAVAWVQGSIWWWDTRAPGSPQDLVRHEAESDGVAFSGDGRLFAEEGEPFFTNVWSFAGPTNAAPTERFKLRNGAWIKRLLFTHDGQWLVRGGSDGLELAELAGPRRVVLDQRGAVEDLALSEDGTVLSAVDRSGRLTVWAAR